MPSVHQNHTDAVLSDCEGFVHHKQAPQGQIINQHFYLLALGNLCDAVRQKQQQKCESGEWHIHYDNEAAHLIQPMQQFFS